MDLLFCHSVRACLDLTFEVVDCRGYSPLKTWSNRPFYRYGAHIELIRFTLMQHRL